MDLYDMPDGAIAAAIGGKVRKMRLEQRASMRAFACKAGVTPYALEQVESGKGGSVSALIKIRRSADALDMLSDLMSEDYTGVRCKKNKLKKEEPGYNMVW